MKKLILTLIISTAFVRADWAWQDIILPGKSGYQAYGISGNNVVLTNTSESTQTYIYNISTASLSPFTAPAVSRTYGWGIENNKVVGSFIAGGNERGIFLNTISNWEALDSPTTNFASRGYTEVRDISGNKLVGFSSDGLKTSAFIYQDDFKNNGSGSWTLLTNPFAYGSSGSTYAYGIDGNIMVGSFYDGTTTHGYLYNINTAVWTTLDALGSNYTIATGISGNNIVGYYYDATGAHGFLYDGSNLTRIDKLGAGYTYLNSIDGNNIVGYADGKSFLLTIPEPSTYGLSFIGLVTLVFSRKLFKRIV